VEDTVAFSDCKHLYKSSGHICIWV